MLLTGGIDRSRYVVLLLVASVLLAVVAICIVAPIYTVLSILDVFRDAATGQLVSHTGILRVLDLVIISLEAVAFYLVGIGLYHLFIARVPLAHRLGLDSLDKLESKLISVVIAMSAVSFVGHLVQGQSATDAVLYGAAVALVVPALTWFKTHLD
jgi:uncharacterized membrane protein YqhA